MAGGMQQSQRGDMPLSARHARPAMAMDDASAASRSIFIYPAVCSVALYALDRDNPVRDSVRIARICFFIGSPFYVKERHAPFLFLPVIGPSRRLCRSHGSGRQACRLPGRARRRSSGRCRPRRGRSRSSSCRWSSRRAAAPRCRRPPP